jgi:hypothetical protein
LIFLSAGIGSIGTLLAAPILPLGALSFAVVVGVRVIVSVALLPLSVHAKANVVAT